MSGRIVVPAERAEELRTYFVEQGIPLEVVTEGEGDLVVAAAPGSRCTGNRLHPGGWITCADAWELAGRLDLPRHRMGGLLTRLEVKIRECQLGCF